MIVCTVRPLKLRAAMRYDEEDRRSFARSIYYGVQSEATGAFDLGGLLDNFVHHMVGEKEKKKQKNLTKH